MLSLRAFATAVSILDTLSPEDLFFEALVLLEADMRSDQSNLPFEVSTNCTDAVSLMPIPKVKKPEVELSSMLFSVTDKALLLLLLIG